MSIKSHSENDRKGARSRSSSSNMQEKYYVPEEIVDFQVEIPEDVTVQVISEVHFTQNGRGLGGCPKIIPQKKIFRKPIFAGKTVIFLKSSFHDSFREINAPSLIQTGNNTFLGIRVLGFSTEELREMSSKKNGISSSK